MSTTTKENHESSAHTDMQSMGRRKLLQALAATGSVAVLGGLKLDLNWEAPFVEISQITAQAASTPAAQFYTLVSQYAAAKTREDFLTQAEPTQAAKRSLKNTSTPNRNSPYVRIIGPRSNTAKQSGGGFLWPHGFQDASADDTNSLYGIQAHVNGGAGTVGLDLSPYGGYTISGAQKSWADLTINSTFVVVSVPASGSGPSYEVELAVGSDATILGVDNGNYVVAVMSMVELTN